MRCAYSLRPALLRRWYPGVGVALADAADRLDWRFHRQLATGGPKVAGVGSGSPLVAVDLDAFRQARGSQLAFTARLLGATAAEQGAPLWSLDTDFRRMARLKLLSLFEPAV